MKSLDLNEDNLQLPQELIDDIIDILSAQESWQAVARCLLVARSFVVRARRHLFSKISTREYVFPSPGRGDSEKIDRLLEILQEDPLRDSHPLALYVRSLRVSMFPASDTRCGPVTRKPEEWNAQRQNLRYVLEKLPNLHTFGLEFTTLMDWNSIQTGMYAGIIKVAESSQLTTLQLTNIYHFCPEHVLARCVNLRDLRLDNIWNVAPSAFSAIRFGSGADPIRKHHDHPKWHPKSLRNLQHIETKCAGDVFVGIMLAKRDKLLVSPLSQMRSFTLTVSPDQTVPEWEAMKCAASSLKRLAVFGLVSSDTTSTFPGPIRLSVFTSLHTLVLSIDVAFRVSPNNLAFTLRSISEPTTIENVTVNFKARYYFGLDTEDEFYSVYSSTTWPTIDNALTGPSFSSLEKVHFDFKWQYYENKFSVDGDDDDQQGSSSTSAEESVRERCKRSQEQKDEILVRLSRRTEAVLPKLARSHRIECTYNNQS
ncbi:hypothetical protein GALMADRAFT_157667 [Galerina marginata CBS 339.88]|uniref:F-box domain-containing protein n=1 Tax=Galerina marginata (strain CBS 339.88) TaxID=685588 RepID=A0A067SUD4_GALM3|nr:hypothetical protein GALMADRAFT_157667 [Galerina marginata CBS 339.88]